MKTKKLQKQPKPGTQLAIALEMLTKARGAWVGGNLLMRETKSMAVHSVIDRLRGRYGFQIENKKKQVSGKTHSSYKLIK